MVEIRMTEKELNRENKILQAMEGKLYVFPESRNCLIVISLVIVVFALCVWGVKGKVNEYVKGVGVITTMTNYLPVTCLCDGVVEYLDVHEGDEVITGQTIGKVFSVDIYLEIMNTRKELDIHNRRLELYRTSLENIKNRKKEVSDVSERHIKENLARINSQIKWFNAYIEKLETVSKRGAIPSNLVADTKFKFDSLLENKSLQEFALIENKLKLEEQLANLEFELDKYQVELEEIKIRAEDVYSRYFESGYIFARDTGKIAEITALKGDQVKKGDTVLYLVANKSDEALLEVTAYFPFKDVRKIEKGMKVRIIPSYIKFERDGAILGTVVSIDRDVVSSKKLQRLYKSETLAEQLFSQNDNLPVKVTIFLEQNSKSPSGFNWTTGVGPEIKIKDNTLFSALVTVNQVAPFELLFGKIQKSVFGKNEQMTLEKANE